MLAICSCESAQNVEKAGYTCWACGEDLRDARPEFLSPDNWHNWCSTRDYHDRPRPNPVGNPHFGKN